MRYEQNTWAREKNFFTTPQHQYNLNDIRVLHTGVDTVKELFNCILKPEVMIEVAERHETGLNQVIEIGGYSFIISKSSKKSGYQWILKNADIGIVVLLKNFYYEIDISASHVKIEGSPHLIASMSPAEYSAFTKKIAFLFATQVKPQHVAVHLAVDLKNWEVEKDFEYKLITRSKRRMSFAGISNASYDLAEVAAIYGNRQTYTFGSASGVQMSVYDKTTEAIKSDKIHFWESIWSTVPSVEDVLESEYQHGDNVTRVEFRFHHSVIQEFCNGSGFQAHDFEQISEHLNGLFHYGLNNFRYQYSTSYIHPVWQMLQEDIFFYNDTWQSITYKRAKKSADDTNNRRRIAIWLGNTIRLHARKRINAKTITKFVMSAGMNEELAFYLGLSYSGSDYSRDYLFDFLSQFIEERLEILILEGVAA